MKRLPLAALVLLCATCMTAQAQAPDDQKGEQELTAEQKQVQSDLLAKCDANKNGRLDKDMMAAIFLGEKAAWAKGFSGMKWKGSEDAAASDVAIHGVLGVK